MFADARGVGVLGLPTSAINPQVAVKVAISIQLLSFILESMYLIDCIIRKNNSKFVYHTQTSFV